MTTYVVSNNILCLLPDPYLLCTTFFHHCCTFFLNKNCLLKFIKNIFLPLWVCCSGYSVYEENTSLNAFNSFCFFITLDLSALDMTITKTKRNHATSLLFAFLPAAQVESGLSLLFLISLNSIQTAVIYCSAKWSPKTKCNSHIIKEWNGYYMYIHNYLLHYNFTLCHWAGNLGLTLNGRRWVTPSTVVSCMFVLRRKATTNRVIDFTDAILVEKVDSYLSNVCFPTGSAICVSLTDESGSNHLFIFTLFCMC